jgi:hypothetical protein
MFIKHAPCPKCTEQNKDKSQDNLGIYENHEYCFSCHYYKKYSNEKIKTVAERSSKFIWQIERELPEKYENYLLNFGLTNSTIKNCYGYCPDLDRLCFFDGKGFIEARSLTKTPKVLTYGTKPEMCFPDWPSITSTIVLVEDVISALKVGYVHPCVPLFGSHISNRLINIIETNKYNVLIWLDKDKIKEAKTFRDKFRAKGLNSGVIFTPKDPKYYYKYQIWDYIKRGATWKVTKIVSRTSDSWLTSLDFDYYVMSPGEVDYYRAIGERVYGNLMNDATISTIREKILTGKWGYPDLLWEQWRQTQPNFQEHPQGGGIGKVQNQYQFVTYDTYTAQYMQDLQNLQNFIPKAIIKKSKPTPP